jgi:hypothetical protein
MRRIGTTAVGILILLYASSAPVPAAAQTAAATQAAAPQLSRDEIREFLLKAKVVKSRDTSKGITAPKRLTLTDGTLTHDAAFQAVDDKQLVANLQGKKGSSVELNFVDSYRYNLGAFALAAILDLDQMMPVHVERRWNGKTGALSWWEDVLMDEGERLKQKVQPPNPTDWNHQMYRMRVFAALVRDTDRNLGNVLITPEWKVKMIDFTRAFRLQTELVYANDLGKIDRALLPRLEGLTRDGIKKATKDYLTGGEIDAVMKRRDMIVAHFKKLIAEQGEDKVLY